MPQRIEVKNLRSGGTDWIEVPTADEQTRDALRRERAGYVTRGLDDRVAAVDDALAAVEQRIKAATAPAEDEDELAGVSRHVPAPAEDDLTLKRQEDDDADEDEPATRRQRRRAGR